MGSATGISIATGNGGSTSTFFVRLESKKYQIERNIITKRIKAKKLKTWSTLHIYNEIVCILYIQILKLCFF